MTNNITTLKIAPMRNPHKIASYGSARSFLNTLSQCDLLGWPGTGRAGFLLGCGLLGLRRDEID